MKLSAVGSITLGLATAMQASYINYTTVTGYFLQDESSTDPSSFDYTAENFGLINRSYDADKGRDGSLTQWERFYRQVVELNEQSKNVDYKVLFLGRHGQGWHNAAESYYGTPAWNCYWSLLDGNGTATWRDATLTSDGTAQAQIAHDFWQKEIDEQHIHTPDSFSGLQLPSGSAPFKPLIKEIHNLFPSWPIEPGFTESDKLWNGVTGETNAAQDIRSKKVLDSVFSSDSGRFVSVTSHSGEISSILRVLGHRKFSLNTGAVIPVLVKATTKEEDRKTTSAPWTVSAHCTAAPVTSVESCVCASTAAPVTKPLL